LERTVNALSLALYFPRNSRETFAQIRGSFARVSREFRESFERVSREFRESFAGVSRTIKRSRARREIKIP
jgi:hypothetical protein